MTSGRTSAVVGLFGAALLLNCSGCSQSNAESTPPSGAPKPATAPTPATAVVAPKLSDVPAVTVTPKAAAILRQHLAATPSGSESYLRIKLATGGCKGFNFTLGIDNQVSNLDKVWTSADVKVVALRSQVEMLQGSTVDFHDSNGPAGFTMKVPNFEGADSAKWIALLKASEAAEDKAN